MKLPLVLDPVLNRLEGCTPAEIEPYYPRDRIRQIERASIRTFMTYCIDVLQERVLDFGCGSQPHRDLCTGHYFGWDVGMAPLTGPYDTVICNQVVQYLPDPPATFRLWRRLLRDGGSLVITYPCNWDEVEQTDLFRFTRAGMESLLRATGFEPQVHLLRAVVKIGHYRFPLGYGVKAVRV